LEKEKSRAEAPEGDEGEENEGGGGGEEEEEYAGAISMEISAGDAEAVG
jgi:hypothetical protein